jgi:hypothetical protein
MAMTCNARFRSRSPPRLRRCRVRCPLLASSGATPASAANAASLRTRPRWDQLTKSWAATTGPTPGSASRVGPAGCCLTSASSSGSSSAGLREQEPDPGRNRPQHQDRHPMLDGRAGGTGEQLDEVQLLEQRLTPQPGSEVLRGHYDEALELVEGFGAADQNSLPGGDACCSRDNASAQPQWRRYDRSSLLGTVWHR